MLFTSAKAEVKRARLLQPSQLLSTSIKAEVNRVRLLEPSLQERADIKGVLRNQWALEEMTIN